MATRKKNTKPRKALSSSRERAAASTPGWRETRRVYAIKFDEHQKEIYLAALREHGLKGKAAEAACVCNLTVINHKESDGDFKSACEDATRHYREYINSVVRKRGAEGWDEPVFHKGARAIEPVLNEDGSHMMTEDGKEMFRYTTIRKFSDNLLILEAKRVDPTYRDKAAIDLNTGGGGVLLVGPGMTPEESIAEGEKANIEANRRHAEREAEKAQGTT